MNVNKVLFTFIKIGAAIVIALVVIYAAIHFSGVSYDFGYRIFTESAIDEDGQGTDIMVEIKSSMSAKEIGTMLEEKGLVRDANLFYLQYTLSAYKGKIVPGIYTLSTSQTPKEMIVKMCPEVEIESTEGTEGENSENSTASTEGEAENGGQE